jgi:hypothetical protein
MPRQSIGILIYYKQIFSDCICQDILYIPNQELVFPSFVYYRSKPEITDKFPYLARVEGTAEANIHIILE